MIEFTCAFCDLGNLSSEVLRCPRCGEEKFVAKFKPEPHLQPMAQTINLSVEPTKTTAFENCEVTGSSASLSEQNESTGKDFILSYEDSAYGIGRPDVEYRGSEDADTINFYSSNISLRQEQLSLNFSQDLTRKRLSSEIQTTFDYAHPLNQQENGNPPSFNFLPNSVCASIAEPQHEINFSDPPSSIECKSQSFAEIMVEKEIATEPSQIQNVDGKMDFACSSRSGPKTSILRSLLEKAKGTKSKLNGTGDARNNSTPDFFSKMGNSSITNTQAEDLASVNKVAQQEAYASNQQTRKEDLENARTMLVQRSSTPISKKASISGKFSKYFRNVAALDVHVQSDCESNPYKCTQCPLTFSTECDLKKHQPVHPEENLLKCDQCSYTAEGKRELALHKWKCH